MIDDRKLSREYKELQKQNTPDLWSRIESGLQPQDRSEVMLQTGLDDLAATEKRTGRRSRYYGWAAAAAAIVGVVLIVGRNGIPGQNTSDLPMATMAQADALAVEEKAEIAGQQNAEQQNADQQVAEQQTAATAHATLQYVNALQVPEHARTVPYNAEYFSEAILKETDLLCGAVITDVSFAYDDSGNASYVIYNMTVSDVYYAEDYAAGMDELSVTSPIIETAGDEAYLLYQMQIGGHYLLPLKGQESGWELLYPFAPQIQVLDQQSFVFHSGYQSLITGQAKVVEGVSQGENDFYYDRMVMREDSTFLSDLITLVK